MRDKKNHMKKTLLGLLLISMVACNVNYEKTPSGLPYKIFKGKDTVKAKPGQFAKFNMRYILTDRDSVFSSTYGSIPAYSPIDTGKRVKYSFMEILPLMSAGDSAEMSISIDTLKNMGVIPDYNAVFAKGQIVKCKIQLLKLFNNEKDMLDDYQKSIDKEKDAETKALESYMSKKNLTGVKTKNGAYVVIENAGDQSLKADSGKVATVMYKGYLENGKVFDTNMDTTKGHTDPIQIPVGSRGSIQGFSECLPYFGKGGKGKFLIPAMLGYGGAPQGSDIPAFSNLIFDIEVTDVTDMPKTLRDNPHADSTND
jgi:FKBP-type peptidyl-prolyl cis-trans isomerase